MPEKKENRIDLEPKTGVQTAINMIPRKMLRENDDSRIQIRETVSGMKTIIGGMKRMRYNRQKKEEKNRTALYVILIIIFVILILSALAFFIVTA